MVIVGHFGNPNGYNDKNQRVLFVVEWGSLTLNHINVNITWAVGAHIEGPIKLSNINPNVQRDWKQPYISYDGFSPLTLEVNSILADFVTCRILINDDEKDHESGPNRARCFWPN